MSSLSRASAQTKTGLNRFLKVVHQIIPYKADHVMLEYYLSVKVRENSRNWQAKMADSCSVDMLEILFLHKILLYKSINVVSTDY